MKSVAEGLAEQSPETPEFAFAERVQVDAYRAQDDAVWVHMPAASFTGTVVDGPPKDLHGEPRVYVMPDEPLPRGHEFASGHPRPFNHVPFWQKSADGSEKGYFRYVIASLSAKTMPAAQS